ncbi:hypothetical protein J3E68DRAFT_414938 [Trichoderma sp. SZMC 28012]
MDLALFRSRRILSYRILWGGTWSCTFLPSGHSTCTWGTHSNQQQARERVMSTLCAIPFSCFIPCKKQHSCMSRKLLGLLGFEVAEHFN